MSISTKLFKLRSETDNILPICAMYQFKSQIFRLEKKTIIGSEHNSPHAIDWDCTWLILKHNISFLFIDGKKTLTKSLLVQSRVTSQCLHSGCNKKIMLTSYNSSLSSYKLNIKSFLWVETEKTRVFYTRSFRQTDGIVRILDLFPPSAT